MGDNKYPYQIKPCYFSVAAKSGPEFIQEMDKFFANMRGYLKEAQLRGISVNGQITLIVNDYSVFNALKVRGYFPIGECYRFQAGDKYLIDVQTTDRQPCIFYFETKNKFNYD